MKIDLASVPVVVGTGYPPPYDVPCRGRERQRLGDAAGLDQFGVNLLRLPPGQWSSRLHRHANEDEFVWVVQGEVWLVGEDGEERLVAGECAGFARGGAAHHIQNRSDAEALLLEMGTRLPVDTVSYPGLDLRWESSVDGYVHLDGTPYASPA